MCDTLLSLKANFKESYMATFYDYFNEQKYADAVKNVSVPLTVRAQDALHFFNQWQEFKNCSGYKNIMI